MSLVPPAIKDGFSYAGDSLYVEASGHNRHRRSTIPEIQAHFKGHGGTKDPPAHWYEAQLLHYGLPPSKVKGTAKMRLLENLNKNALVVPAHIQKIESDLKKEWTKKDREARKALKNVPSTMSPAKGTKRKADDTSKNAGNAVNFNLALSINSNGGIQVQAASPPPKKARNTEAGTKIAAKSTPKATSQGASKTAPKATSTAASKTTHSSSAAAAPKERMARRGGAKAQGRGSSPKVSKSTPPAKEQTARRGGSAIRGRISSPGPVPAFDEPPPPYSEVIDDDYGNHNDYAGNQHYDHDDYDDYSSRQHYDSLDEEQPYSPPAPVRRLGLLNGRYEVDCPSLAEDFPDFPSDFALILTLDGNKLWGSFDFGSLTGILHISRPYEVSESDNIGFFWRGHAYDASYSRRYYCQDTLGRRGPGNTLGFRGEGEVEGRIQYGPPGSGSPIYEFTAYRIGGQETRSEISPASMRQQWEELAP